MYAQRKLKDECFDNFFNHFTKTFQQKIVNHQGDVKLAFELYEDICKRFSAVVNDWNRNQDTKAAKDFWNIVGMGNKFLKHL